MKVRGFTLIELMVVIAIIGVLSVVALASYSSVQKNSRDAKRRDEVTTIANAIESSRDAVTGNYTFSLSQLQKEFPTGSPAASGKDPSGNYYCIIYNSPGASYINVFGSPPDGQGTTAPTQSGQGNYSSGAPAGSCANSSVFTYTTSLLSSQQSGLTFSDLSSAISGSTPGFTSTSYTTNWIICAYMESISTPFCKSSFNSRTAPAATPTPTPIPPTNTPTPTLIVPTSTPTPTSVPTPTTAPPTPTPIGPSGALFGYDGGGCNWVQNGSYYKFLYGYGRCPAGTVPYGANTYYNSGDSVNCNGVTWYRSNIAYSWGNVGWCKVP